MEIETWWPMLSTGARGWLVAHNGEPLDPDVAGEIREVTGGSLDGSWWAGASADGVSELTDAAIDWIETTANGETPGA